jgi:hypothetical protein
LKPIHITAYYPDLRNSTLPLFAFFAERATYRLRFMDKQTRLSPPRNEATLNLTRRNTMNASKLFAAVAAVVFAGSAFAADLPAANAAATGAAAASAQVSVAARSLNVPAILVDKSASPTRAQVRAEAIEALKTQRATEAGQFDWLTK